MDSLKSLFPSPYHHYNLIEKSWGFSFATLHWSYYLLGVVLATAFLYYMLAWEASKWTDPFKVPFSWLIFIVSFGIGGGLATIALFFAFGHEIPKLEVNIEDKSLIVHGVILKTKIPFSAIEEIRVSSDYVPQYKSTSARNNFYLFAGKEQILCFRQGTWTDTSHPSYSEFLKYATALANALNEIIKQDISSENRGFTMEEQQLKDPEIKEFTGKLIEEPFVNKAGRVIPNMGDLFLEIGKEKHFIKLMEGNVLRVDLEKYLNQTIKIKGYMTSGLWDTDDPEMQSRMGDYMVILDIL